MRSDAAAKLRIGDWCVDPTAGRMARGDNSVRLEARTLRLLLDLADHPGEVVSIDDLLERVWAGVIVTPDSVYQAVATLRRLLGDDPREPRYIATVPRLGYRLVANVSPWLEPAPSRADWRRRSRWLAGAAAAALGALAVAAVVLPRMGQSGAAAPSAPVAVGVLPFLDMTPSMDQEVMADDVTEGLVDTLSRNARLRTPGFRASLLLKGKHATPTEGAKALGVAYVVDGSVRRQGDLVRVAARLIRADSGFVIWSQTYVQPVGDLPAVEGAIANGIGGVLARPAARAG